MHLTEEIVKKIFNDCCIFEENKDDNNFHIVNLRFPLLDGCTRVIFNNTKLDEYKDIIVELFNNIYWLEGESHLPFLGLMKTIDGNRWTESVYDMEKLYALLVASNLISLKEIDRGLVVTHINEDIKVRKIKI